MLRSPTFLTLIVAAVIAATWGLSRATTRLSPAVADSVFHVMPRPARLVPRPGTFSLEAEPTIRLSDPTDPELLALGEFATDLLGASGVTASVASEAARQTAHGAIHLLLDPTDRDPEAYRLIVSDRSIEISASGHAGLFYGLQTLGQLVPDGTADSGSTSTGGIAIPAVEIEDSPRFPYRGMHLDVARHFFPTSFVKRYIDLIARYKLNRFHWHLTEDQGWRIEIKKYPRLTDVGAYRKETIVEKNFRPYMGDGTPHGGFYTQDEIRDVVAYARSRYVTVIPEIEMPGHSLAALAAYPELACTDGPFEVGTVWGVYDDIYCPSERTFAFLEDVLTEVLELFPSRYIHIGGDEAPKTRWRASELAQSVIRREGLADEHELQGYFIKRIERFLARHGRALIGWDEILEGGLPPEATVMSWRGMDGGIAAAKQGHDVIMTPGSHVYFDHYQGAREFEPLAIGGYTPLDKVYAFEPVPQSLSAAEARHVLGAQGNVWTEYIKTPEHVEYMVFPRLLALSEVVWSPRDLRDWQSFAARLPAQLRYLDRQGVSYRIPHVQGLERDQLTLVDEMTVELSALLPESEIFYTTDGTDPTRASILYQGPFTLSVDESGTEVRARAFLPNGRASPVKRSRFAKTTLQTAEDPSPTDLEPGLRYAYYEARMASVTRLANYSPVRQGIAATVQLQGFERAEEFGLVFTGYLRVPRDGLYTFWLTSDDGSDLIIGDRTVIDHDGLHSATDQAGTIGLEAGLHRLTVRFFQRGGGRDLRLTGRLEGEGEFSTMADWLFFRPSQ